MLFTISPPVKLCVVVAVSVIQLDEAINVDDAFGKYSHVVVDICIIFSKTAFFR